VEQTQNAKRKVQNYSAKFKSIKARRATSIFNFALFILNFLFYHPKIQKETLTELGLHGKNKYREPE